ncbi:MAG: FAD-dependent oxidoreductase [Clostridia bacterium]|nr:FAD-dependent oxidoreductase [Clostridia bacterium]
MRYVIIGGSVAGIAAAESIRKTDKEGEIVILTDEKYPAYGRPTISYYLNGRISRENMAYRDEDFYIKNDITLRLGERAVKIDPKKKEVETETREKIAYDRLLVAAGSSPFVPPTEGYELVKSRHTFMTMDDALSLEKDLGTDKDVLVVGAGLIGLKCIEGIYGKVKKITCVDMADRVLPSVLDAEGAKIIQTELEGKGVEFVLNDSVAKFADGKATLKSGRKISFDILVMAVGVRPNTSLVSDAGGKVNRGICVNTYMETSLPGVYAAGDCAEGYDSSVNQDRVIAILPNAYFQGRVAGANMALPEGGTKEQLLDAVPMNAVGFFGTHVLSAGSYEGECISDTEGGRYRKLFVKDGFLKGFILIGDFERAGIYTSLIRGKVPLEGLDTELLAKAPQLLAFSKDERKRKLAQKV